MSRVSPCVSTGGRWYGAQALRSAAFGGSVFNFPAIPTTRSRGNDGGATAALFHICGRRCGREIGGGGVHPGGLGRAAVELLCGCTAHTGSRSGVAELLRRGPARG